MIRWESGSSLLSRELPLDSGSSLLSRELPLDSDSSLLSRELPRNYFLYLTSNLNQDTKTWNSDTFGDEHDRWPAPAEKQG